MLRYLVVFLLVVCIPTLTIARKSLSQSELERELFKHVEFPCAANMTISVLKEKELENESREDLTTTGLIVLQSALAKMKEQTAKAAAPELGLVNWSRRQRRGLYQVLVAGCLEGVFDVSAANLLDDNYITALGANGWEFTPTYISGIEELR